MDPSLHEFGVKEARKIITGIDAGSEEYLQRIYRPFRYSYERDDGTNGSGSIVVVATKYINSNDPLYAVKKRSYIR